MNIVIVGDGKVGSTLATELSQEDHDVVVIDTNNRVLENIAEELDVMTISGNGATLEVQKAAGVEDSDLLIAATSSDEVNLLCCILARKLGCSNTIARVRNPEYDAQLQFLRDDLGLSMTVNPEKAAAHEIFRLLQFPSFLKRDIFANGHVELVEIKIKPDSVLDGVKLSRFYEIAKVKVLVCVVNRGGEIVIPSGSFTLQTGDQITVTAATRDLAVLIKNLDIAKQRVHKVVIIGGSRIAVYLAHELAESRIGVKIIEQNPDRCRELSELLPNVLVIEGNGASSYLLRDEDVAGSDAVVTLTGIDEENLILSMYANHLGVPTCIPKINRVEYAEMLKDRGIETFVSPKLLTTEDIIRYVRAMENTSGSEVNALTRIADGDAEALEFVVDAQFSGVRVPLRDLAIKPGILIACIMRGSKIIIPGGADFMQTNDTVIVVTSSDHAINNLKDIISHNSRTGWASAFPLGR